jgi:molybdopterin-containing oxidoreductase family iron-sulfur binding subunit
VVLSLDADFLTCGPGNLRHVADFMARRRVRTTADEAPQAQMNRLYVVETMVSSTGAKADHRLALRAGEIENFARAVAARLGVLAAATELTEPQARWAAAVAKDLEQHRERCVVLAGDRQPPVVHVLAHVLNDRLGNVGKTVIHTAPVEAEPIDQLQSLRELVEDMEQGRVETLLILGGNPVYTAPADFRFAERMQKVPLRAHLSLYQNETSRQCHWHLPEAHYLEAWGDARAYDGTASLVQPLIEPLYQGWSAHELLSVFTNSARVPGLQTVRGYWRRYWEERGRPGSFDQFWQTALHDGIIAGTAFQPRSVSLKEGWQKHLESAPESKPAAPGEYEIVFQADPTIYDGCFANNGWLQELPKPITKLTWDNAAIMSPATAKALGLGYGSYAHGGEHGGYHMPVVALELQGRKVEAPVWIMPGHADASVTVYLGYGREYAGRVGGSPGSPVGFDAYRLRTSEHPRFAPGLAIHKTSKQYLLACTQAHQLMENREVVRASTLEGYRREPSFALEKEREQERLETAQARKPLTLYEPSAYPAHKWGMVIDLTACTGCKACVVACQAENNIPVVGKDQVAAGREMHWLRIDRYIEGPFEEWARSYSRPAS